MARPEIYPVKKLVGLTAAQVAAIEAFRAEHGGTASDVIRQAVDEFMQRTVRPVILSRRQAKSADRVR